MEKVLLVQRYLPHFRLPLFRHLGRNTIFNWSFVAAAHPGAETTGLPADPSNLPIQFVSEYQLGKFYYLLGTPFLLITKPPDVLILPVGWTNISNLPMLIFAQIMNIPVIGWGKGIPENRRRRPWFYRVYIWLVTQLFDRMIVYGETSAQYFVNLGIARSRLYVAPNTVDVQHSEDELDDSQRRAKRIRRRLGYTDRPVVGYFGRVDSHKSPDVILNGFIQMRDSGTDAYLIVAGEGDLLPELRAMAEGSDYASAIHFPGRIPLGQEGRWFKTFDLFVSGKNAGLAVREAMSYSVPVLVPPESRPELEGVANGHTGFVLPDYTPSSLSRTLGKLLPRTEHLKKVGRAGRDWVLNNATLNHMTKAFERAVSDALGESSDKY